MVAECNRFADQDTSWSFRLVDQLGCSVGFQLAYDYDRPSKTDRQRDRQLQNTTARIWAFVRRARFVHLGFAEHGLKGSLVRRHDLT